MSEDPFATSVIGARHRRHGEPRQDAAGWSRTGPPFVVTAAVADGHGDRRCPRSQDGARFAVACAPEAAEAWGSGARTDADGSGLAAQLVTRWRAAVDDDLARRSAGFGVADDSNGSDDAAASPRLLYGTTLVVAVATDVAVTVLRIGDGDAIGVSSDGVAYRLLDPYQGATPGETSSLSADDAARSARSRTVSRAEAPALIVLVTDGVVDAYPDDEGLLGACRDLHERWRDRGRDHAQHSVAEWVRAAAEHSGDDASAAVLRLWDL